MPQKSEFQFLRFGGTWSDAALVDPRLPRAGVLAFTHFLPRASQLRAGTAIQSLLTRWEPPAVTGHEQRVWFRRHLHSGSGSGE